MIEAATAFALRYRRAWVFAMCLTACVPGLRAQQGLSNGAPIEIVPLAGEVHIDGDLSEEAWQKATDVTSWYETNPADNIPAPVPSAAHLAYDDHYLYAAFEFDDPDPTAIRAPLADRDDVPGYTDYGGIILDASNDGRSAQMFLANAAGIQYDAISNDSSGEDSSPDFFWESAGRITPRGWQLEIRIPFSSIRYTSPDPTQWGILLYRNRPRDFRYQYFSSRLPRDRNCFICNVRPLVGLKGLPQGSHWIAAPYATAGLGESTSELGAPLERNPSEQEVGLDFKWLPNPNTIVDITLNPDFSQIESDVALISANERFALFQPERRPFFLEGVDLLATPMPVLYTRTFTSPRWGSRITGGSDKTRYTLLVGEDRGGGSVILPGPNGSSLAAQDFESLVAMGRFRRDLGRSFVSFVYSGREIEGGAFNRVFGPDFRWRPNEKHTITGQLVFSTSETPERPDLAEEWDGRSLAGHMARLSWGFSDAKWDAFALYRDVSDEFRADNGFIPQVGYRFGYTELGRTFRPQDGPVRRVRTFVFLDRNEDREGNLLSWEVVPGFGLDALWNSFVRLELGFDEVLGTERTFRRFQLRPTFDVRPGKVLSRISVRGSVGDEVDFTHDRPATGGTLRTTTELRPSDRLRLSLTYDRRWLDVEPEGEPGGRLLTASVARLRGVYNFSTRSWLRLVAQWVETEREPRLYEAEVERRTGDFAGSLVFAYKLNWQTVLFVGYSDARALDGLEQLQPTDRQAFTKVSYAFRR